MTTEADLADALPPLPEPAAHMYPSDLERFERKETFAQAFSVAVGCPDEHSVPLYRQEQVLALLRTKAAALAEREWIAVSERLPEQLTPVLTFGPLGRVTGAWQKRDDYPSGRLWALAGRSYSADRQELFAPTHWQPLPDMPFAAAPSTNKEAP